jgi:hypothetical protein
MVIQYKFSAVLQYMNQPNFTWSQGYFKRYALVPQAFSICAGVIMSPEIYIYTKLASLRHCDDKKLHSY